MNQLLTVGVKQVVDEYPDLSWLETKLDACGNIVDSCRYTQKEMAQNPEQTRRYIEEDHRRLKDYGRTWWMEGIYAVAEIAIPRNTVPPCRLLVPVQSGGLWGIESDSDDEHKRSVAREELAQLRDVLAALNVDLTGFDQLAEAVLADF